MIALDELEAAAAAVLEPSALDYFRGGADDELTLADNVAAWRRLRLRPHVLRDVSVVDSSTTVLGTPVATPILVAPTAFHRLASPEGESGTAAGAAAAGTVMVLSTMSTEPLEAVAARPGDRGCPGGRRRAACARRRAAPGDGAVRGARPRRPHPGSGRGPGRRERGLTAPRPRAMAHVAKALAAMTAALLLAGCAAAGSGGSTPGGSPSGTGSTPPPVTGTSAGLRGVAVPTVDCAVGDLQPVGTVVPLPAEPTAVVLCPGQLRNHKRPATLEPVPRDVLAALATPDTPRPTSTGIACAMYADLARPVYARLADGTVYRLWIPQDRACQHYLPAVVHVLDAYLPVGPLMTPPPK